MSPIRIVVAEDHPVVLAGVVEVLESAPDLVVVAQAVDGHHLVEAVDRTLPDIVITDLRMPGLRGHEATAIIRTRHPAIKVIVLTTFETDTDILPAIEAGASGYLLKAAPREEILTGVRLVAAGDVAMVPDVAAALVDHILAPMEALTARETQILRLVAAGSSNGQIARELFVGEATVKTHLVHAFAKLGVGDRTRAVAAAVQRRLL
jgi:DNA-binding NarL/FixJ family response regulator